MNYEEAINFQYGKKDIAGILFSKFREEKIETLEKIQNVLTPIQELHLRGRGVTLELAKGAGINEDVRVLDVGCGIGGSARVLASEFGCKVTGLDLCEEFCRTAEIINKKIGLSEKIEIRQGNALHMPFDDEFYDVVIVQHVLMNIKEKNDLLSQINRVLRPKGRLAINTICEGTVIPIYYPVIWANDPDISFLLKVNNLRKLINNCGFKELSWKDDTKNVIEGIDRIRAKPRPNEPRPIRLGMIVEDSSTKWKNMVKNLKEGRIFVIQGIFEKKK
ncbi:MAG: class I SAM-dependent methyltransferase [Promethearchaeota archaeon]